MRILIAASGIGLLVVGCDQVSQPDVNRPPSVHSLAVMPDSVEAAKLPPDRVQDSVAQVSLRIGVNATDSDGSVDRVVFTLEPSSNPRGTISDVLAPTQGDRYQRDLGLGIPVFRDEVYTIRVFAVDDDSLASNQVVGRFRFVAE